MPLLRSRGRTYPLLRSLFELASGEERHEGINLRRVPVVYEDKAVQAAAQAPRGLAHGWSSNV